MNLRNLTLQTNKKTITTLNTTLTEFCNTYIISPVFIPGDDLKLKDINIPKNYLNFSTNRCLTIIDLTSSINECTQNSCKTCILNIETNKNAFIKLYNLLNTLQK